MRIFDLKTVKCDKRFLICFGITLILAIILGIVLCKISTINSYFVNYADIYIFYVFSFSFIKLFFGRLFCEIFYLYVIFLISCFTRFKPCTLVFVFIKSIFIVIYSVILCSFCGFGGVMTCVFIFIPTSAISLLCCYACADFCKCINKKYALFFPGALAFIISLIMLILHGVIFRIVIAIV